MPKIKTHSGAKKRFKVTASGKVSRRQAFKNHILDYKSTKQKRRLSAQAFVHSADMPRISEMLVI